MPDSIQQLLDRIQEDVFDIEQAMIDYKLKCTEIESRSKAPTFSYPQPDLTVSKADQGQLP